MTVYVQINYGQTIHQLFGTVWCLGEFGQFLWPGKCSHSSKNTTLVATKSYWQCSTVSFLPFVVFCSIWCGLLRPFRLHLRKSRHQNSAESNLRLGFGRKPTHGYRGSWKCIWASNTFLVGTDPDVQQICTQVWSFWQVPLFQSSYLDLVLTTIKMTKLLTKRWNQWKSGTKQTWQLKSM